MANEGLISGENEKREGDVSNRNAKRINVGNEGEDANVEMYHRTPNYDKRVELERKRRKAEIQLYEELRVLLPKLPPQVYKSKILDEAMKTIKELKQTLHNLKEQKLKRLRTVSANTSTATLLPSESLVSTNNEAIASMNLGNIVSVETSNFFKTWISSNVTLCVCGTDAIFNICSLKNPELFTNVCFILETHNLETVSAQISSDHAKTMYMIRVHGIVDPELTNGVPYEEICKCAMSQIVQLVI